MLKKDITFENLDGVMITETFYFNMTKIELAEMKFSMGGGFEEHMKDLAASNDASEILVALKEIIRKTVGKRLDDGVTFDKDEAYTNRFMNSGAYSELAMEMLTDSSAAVQFMRSVIPNEISQRVAKQLSEIEAKPAVVIDLPSDEAPVEQYTTAELLEMDSAKFAKLAGTDPHKMTKDHLLVAFQRRAAGR